MNEGSFKEQVKEGLKNLNRQQQVEFAWRCAVRALPFLGYQGSFDFWEKVDRKKHLYSIFYSLDFAYTNADNADIAYIAYAAVNAAANATNANADAAYDAANAAYAAAYAAANNNDKKSLTLQNLILNDLQGKANTTPVNPYRFYGSTWTKFQQALEEEGCSYWGSLYQSIFKSGFKLDKDALGTRISVPKEIRNKGAAVVASYLKALKNGFTRLNESRLIILGDKGSGKTSLARRLIDPKAPMPKQEESTAGVDTSLWQPEAKEVNVRIWDFAGHTVTHAVHQCFLSERCLYVIVYNGRTEEKNRLEYWLNNMKNYGGDSKAIILVNERDHHGTDIKTNFLTANYPIMGIYHFSIRDDTSELECFRQDIAYYMESNPSWEKQTIPSSYYQVKEVLERHFSNRKVEHITREEFDQLTEECKVNNNEHLLISLDCLGISLWYEEMTEFNTLVLNPEWISHGVYKIINWAHKAKQHSLSRTDFIRVFSDERDKARYPENKHDFLFNLMKHYELAYETDKDNHLVIPHLLNEDQPASLPRFDLGEGLMLRYKAEQPLPPNTISRFIVRHHQQIKKGQQENSVWRYGVILEDTHGSQALVQEDDRSISVSVKGVGKTNFIAELRETLNDIFNSYKSDKPELQYRIERDDSIPDEMEEKYPVWLSDRKVLNQSKAGVPYYDDVSGQPINLRPIVNSFGINSKSLIVNIEKIVLVGGTNNQVLVDQSTNNIFNFHDCNIDLQGNLNELARQLKKAGEPEEAEELKEVVEALGQLEECESQDEVKKKGLADRLKYLVEELEDKDSKISKIIKRFKNGTKITQDIAKKYNQVAEWLALPQVPKDLLK